MRWPTVTRPSSSRPGPLAVVTAVVPTVAICAALLADAEVQVDSVDRAPSQVPLARSVLVCPTGSEAGGVFVASDAVEAGESGEVQVVAGGRASEPRTVEVTPDRRVELADATRVSGAGATAPGLAVQRWSTPGLRAVEELDAYSPLLEHDITKEEVREIARDYGLSVSEKPSMACLSSRIPTGLKVTEERLTRVEKAETLLRTWGFEQFRVRDHDGLARIEVAPDELERALDPDFARAAREHLTDIGFEHVTLDLAGYRTGSVSPGDSDLDLGAEYPTAED